MKTIGTQQASRRAWHTESIESCYELLHSSAHGLTDDEAKSRLQSYGPNRLPEKPPTSVWRIFLRQFLSPLIYILIAAAIVSLLIGDLKDAGFIAAVLFINALIGAFQEWKAEQSSLALRKLLQIHAVVERNGQVRTESVDGLVPGDVVWLESGNRVPADLRLIFTHGLEIDESLLTGESLPVDKQSHWMGDRETAMAEQANMAFAGSIVTRGRSRGLVVATGTATNVGQLALDMAATVGGKPPLLQRMERFTNVIAVATLVLATSIGLFGWTMGRFPAAEMFLFIVAIAVSSIPEGLPVAMTVALAIATTRMAKRGVIVRRLTAVEGLGSCTLIATDKTGTLTVNELTVKEIRLPDGREFTVSGEGFAPNGEVLWNDQRVGRGEVVQLDDLAQAGALCNEADLHQLGEEWKWHGDAVDVALLTLAAKLGCPRSELQERFPLIHQIPFESEHQYAATFHRLDGETLVFVKGAPERVLSMCDASIDRQVHEAAAMEMARQGFRVLAMASGTLAAEQAEKLDSRAPESLAFLGMVGMIDPLRPGVREAVEACHAAGVDVTMVTGDHRVTALAIARDLGLATDETQVLTGPEIAAMTPQDLEVNVRNVRVFARVAPRQKLEIVEAARRSGRFVAVTGDGVNDAPALRAANIGVAMGKSGTDVAREAAELVISDDNFATIVAGIEEGRVAYDNIRKVIYLLISTGAAELVLVGLAVLSGVPLPLLPVQLLWLNLVTNGIQDVALAFEPSEGDVLKRKPRSKSERVFNRLMIERTIVASLVGGCLAFAVFYWMIAQGWSEASARNGLLLFMVLFENFHIGNCRSETKSAFVLSPLRSPILLGGAIIAFLIHVAAMHLPFMQTLLETEPVSIKTWIFLAVAAVAIVPTMELHKWLWQLRFRRDS